MSDRLFVISNVIAPLFSFCFALRCLFSVEHLGLKNKFLNNLFGLDMPKS